MTDKPITIMAKAMQRSKAWPVVYQAGSAAALATAAFEALLSAGYWVERWRPIGDHVNARNVLVMSDDSVSEAYIDSTGDWRLRGGGYVADDPAFFMPLPPPPPCNRKGAGDDA